MATLRRISLVLAVILIVGAVEAAPFLDAIYDALSGNGGWSNGYNNGYNYGYDGYNGYHRQREVQKTPREGKSYKEICRVHFPDSVAFPGKGGIVCPY